MNTGIIQMFHLTKYRGAVYDGKWRCPTRERKVSVT